MAQSEFNEQVGLFNLKCASAMLFRNQRWKHRAFLELKDIGIPIKPSRYFSTSVDIAVIDSRYAVNLMAVIGESRSIVCGHLLLAVLVSPRIRYRLIKHLYCHSILISAR